MKARAALLREDNDVELSNLSEQEMTMMKPEILCEADRLKKIEEKKMEIRKKMDILREEEKMLADLPMPPAQDLHQDGLSDKTLDIQSLEDLDYFIKRY